MAHRIISSLVGIPLFIGICLWGVTPFTIAITLVAALGLTEMLTSYRKVAITPNPIVSALGLLGPLAPLGLLSTKQMLVVCFGALITALVYEVVVAARTGAINSGRNIAYGLLCGAYISLFGGLTSLRAWQGSPSGHMPFGAALVLLAVFCVWATDTLALFAGRAFGRHKLAPRLSPAKTVQGALGGLLGALAIGGALSGPMVHSLGEGLLIGAIAGVFGQVGDLFESSLKREIGVKDFGSILPGHGGILDRFDSLLFVAPITAIILFALWS